MSLSVWQLRVDIISNQLSSSRDARTSLGRTPTDAFAVMDDDRLQSRYAQRWRYRLACPLHDCILPCHDYHLLFLSVNFGSVSWTWGPQFLNWSITSSRAFSIHPYVHRWQLAWRCRRGFCFWIVYLNGSTKQIWRTVCVVFLESRLGKCCQLRDVKRIWLHATRLT